eukprot:scaffold5155_cov182-Isochrysis_galbana.AAC.1
MTLFTAPASPPKVGEAGESERLPRTPEGEASSSIDGSVMIALRLFAPPHDNPPSLAGEGDPIPSAQTQAHFPSTWRRGKE